MKHKVAELDGTFLDAAVAKAEGMTVEIADSACYVIKNGTRLTGFAPSISWLHGGPIIERENIDLKYLGNPRRPPMGG
jgi:hypothetical protein